MFPSVVSSKYVSALLSASVFCLHDEISVSSQLVNALFTKAVVELRENVYECFPFV
jgi:hypothetical protein